MCKRFLVSYSCWFMLPLATLVALSGCGRKEDLNKAKSVVETSLTSWKNGESPKRLTDEGIEITDPDWLSGHRLLDFNFKSTTSQPQQGPRVVVMLEMQDRGGRKVSREVAYEVLLGDKVRIGRDAFHVGP